MKRLFPALLLCLSLWSKADEFSQPFDVVGTPLQQDFKVLYREVHKAEPCMLMNTL